MMYQIVDEGYIFTINEFITLLNGMGYENIYGLISEEFDINEQDIVEALNKLVQREILVSGEDKFVIKDEYKALFSNVGSAEYIVCCSNPNAGNVFCIYAKDSLVMCNQNQYKENILCMKQENNVQKEWFYDEKAIPQKSETDVLNELLFEENIESKEESEIFSTTKIIDIESKEKTLISIMKARFSYYMVIEKEGNSFKEPYTEEKYVKIVSHITGGKIEW